MTLAQGVALRPVIEKIEFLFNPVSSIQHLSSLLL